jgi:hypothetical protein
MNHCAHCESLSAVGTQAMNLCTECGAANVAGGSFQVLPAIAAVAIATVVWFVARRVARGVSRALAVRTA